MVFLRSRQYRSCAKHMTVLPSKLAKQDFQRILYHKNERRNGMSCYSEGEIAKVVLEIIKDNPGIRTSRLIDTARKKMRPDGEDLEILDNRNDDKFSQKVRNIKSHDTISSMVRTVGERNRQWFLK